MVVGWDARVSPMSGQGDRVHRLARKLTTSQGGQVVSELQKQEYRLSLEELPHLSELGRPWVAFDANHGRFDPCPSSLQAPV